MSTGETNHRGADVLTGELIVEALRATEVRRKQIQGFFYQDARPVSPESFIGEHVVRDLCRTEDQVIWRQHSKDRDDYHVCHAAMMAQIEGRQMDILAAKLQSLLAG